MQFRKESKLVIRFFFYIYILEFFYILETSNTLFLTSDKPFKQVTFQDNFHHLPSEFCFLGKFAVMNPATDIPLHLYYILILFHVLGLIGTEMTQYNNIPLCALSNKT